MTTRSFTRWLTVVAVLCASAPMTPQSAGAQEEEHPISQCICRTTTRTEPITVLGIQIGTRTITETQCWYEPG
jgi:hypothetical protein